MLTVEEDLDAHALRRQGWSISAIARHPGRIELPPPPPPPPPPARSSMRRQAPVQDPLEPTATRDCPHCQQPITIVGLLATPQAARPGMPRHRTGVLPLRRALPERAL
ncbi:hypothetical protein N7U49_48860 (plasmid) [Streptomyces sp. AD2-2]|nr:hypothetical protein N7U49_48860 [Streptomyces sp. AD2-2]